MEEYKGKVRLVVKHAPYPYRDYAKLAARASLAAAEQGAFWPMHDLMLQNYRKLDPKSLLEYARSLNLDLNRFQKDLDSARFADRVEEDVKLARSLDIYQTPTFVINGRTVVVNGRITSERPGRALRGPGYRR